MATKKPTKRRAPASPPPDPALQAFVDALEALKGAHVVMEPTTKHVELARQVALDAAHLAVWLHERVTGAHLVDPRDPPAADDDENETGPATLH